MKIKRSNFAIFWINSGETHHHLAILPSRFSRVSLTSFLRFFVSNWYSRNNIKSRWDWMHINSREGVNRQESRSQVITGRGEWVWTRDKLTGKEGGRILSKTVKKRVIELMQSLFKRRLYCVEIEMVRQVLSPPPSLPSIHPFMQKTFEWFSCGSSCCATALTKKRGRISPAQGSWGRDTCLGISGM